MKAAVIGCGRMGAFTSEGVRRFAPACWLPLAHAEAIETAEGIDLAALCDPSADALSRAAERYGVDRTYSDHRAMLADGAPDLVGIATRTIGRAGIIEDCIAAGVRAFHIEKPVCNSVAELERLERLFAREDVFVTLGAVRRHFPIYREAASRANSGVFGSLAEIRIDMGEAPLFWTHPHSVDLILHGAAGRTVASVQARLGATECDSATVRNDPVIQSATVWFDDGVAGHIGRAPGTDFHLACRQGKLAVMNDGHELLETDYSGDDPYPRPHAIEVSGETACGGALAPVRQLLACLKGDPEAIAANAVLKRDILLGQRILFGFVQSHLEGGAAIHLDSLDPELTVEGRSGSFYA